MDNHARDKHARVHSLHRSNGGVPKLGVSEAAVTRNGMSGDKQRQRRFHGGPERALCLYAIERIAALQAEGHPIAPGTAGENITFAGLDWNLVVPGVRLAIGDEAEIEIASFTTPCKTIRESFAEHDFTRISEKLNPGWSRVYARVLSEGTIRVGDAVTLHSSGVTA
ncbi:MAG: MOSC domain-containing protein [Gemmatimonadota bacterium]|nr:MOSC domain-containing protein [Gemmatimonadota bacterium]